VPSAGTTESHDTSPGIGTAWPACPVFPPDLFAAAAYLLDIAGAYHYLIPGDIKLTASPASGEESDEGVSDTAPTPEFISLDNVDINCPNGSAFVWTARNQWASKQVAGLWACNPKTPKLVVQLWNELGKHKDDKVFVTHSSDRLAPRWWSIACHLMIIADQACPDVGHGFSDQGEPEGAEPTSRVKAAGIPEIATEDMSWTSLCLTAIIADKHEKASEIEQIEDDSSSKSSNYKCNGGGNGFNGIGENEIGQVHLSVKRQLWALSLSVNLDVACVQAKSLSKNIGCSLRNMSLNLALVPPRGIARSIWHKSPFLINSDDKTALNILLVPFPFHIPAKSFHGDVCLTPQSVRESRGDHEGVLPWGRFSLQQSWLHGWRDPKKGDETKTEEENNVVEKEAEVRRKALFHFVNELMVTAKRDVSSIHGVIFPEYSLDWDTYKYLVHNLCRQHPNLEFFVAGSSQNCEKEKGNFAVSSVITRKIENEKSTKVILSTSRAKHHRWQLDESQISNYALASALDPRVLWWENIRLSKREVHVNVFRDTSTFAAMICEDLARVDPCHPVLRAMAPNLVFVLLMDGPQLPTRWSSRYSTILADDPGSSVLTLTSRALIQRSNTTRQDRAPSWSVALWKDDSGREVPIACDPTAHGVVLSLSGYRTTEISLDGRSNPKARSWRYHGHQPVRITQPCKNSEKSLRPETMEDIVKLVTGAYAEVPPSLEKWHESLQTPPSE